MSARAGGLLRRGQRDAHEPETAEQTIRRLGSETAEQTSLRLGLEAARQRRRRISLAAAGSAIVFASGAFLAFAHFSQALGFGKHGVWGVVFALSFVVFGVMHFLQRGKQIRRWWKQKREDGIF